MPVCFSTIQHRLQSRTCSQLHPPRPNHHPDSVIYREAKILHNQGFDMGPKLNGINAKPETWKMEESWNFLALHMKQYRHIPLNQWHVNMYEGRTTPGCPGSQALRKVCWRFAGGLLSWVKLFYSSKHGTIVRNLYGEVMVETVL